MERNPGSSDLVCSHRVTRLKKWNIYLVGYMYKYIIPCNAFISLTHNTMFFFVVVVLVIFIYLFIYFGNTAQRKMFIFVRRVENDLARGKEHGLSPAYSSCSSCSLIFLPISDMYKEKIVTVPKRVQIWYTVCD